MARMKPKTLAEQELDFALQRQNYHLENAEVSRQAVRRAEELAREREIEVVYWQRIVELEKANAA